MIDAIREHVRVAEALAGQVAALEAIADGIVDCFRSGGRLFVFGNGGSAADAQHVAAELVGRFKLDRQALPAVALTTDTSTLTAVGNDLGGEHIFRRQVEALVTERDIVWAISVSGTSPNVIAAVHEARQRGATVIGLTSRRGNELRELCSHCVAVDHDSSDRVQEVHQLAYHLICERIEQAVAAEPVNAGGQRAVR